MTRAPKEIDRRFIAERFLARWEDDRRAAFQYVADQSKWMVAQLFVVNAGSLAALAASDGLRPFLFKAGGWFVAGVVLSISAGLATWAHAQAIVRLYDNAANPAMVTDKAQWPPVLDPNMVRLAAWLYGGAVACGVLSLVAFAAGAIAVAAS